jgi:hypothetical protein
VGFALTTGVVSAFHAGAHTIGGKGFGEMYVFDNTYYTTLIGAPLYSDV